MEDLNKTENLNIRISPVQLERLTEAAETVSRERGEKVEPTALARELINEGVARIRSSEPAAARTGAEL